MKRHRKKHGVAVEREQLALPCKPNQVWLIDLVSDALSNGRRVKVLTIVDDFTKEAVDLVADNGISDQYVVRVLQRAAPFVDCERQFEPTWDRTTLVEPDQRAHQNGVQLKLIELGKPTQNAFSNESSNARFMDDCLNNDWFTSLAEARIQIAARRRDYNEHHPHSALNYQTPAEFAANYRQKEATQDTGKIIN